MDVLRVGQTYQLTFYAMPEFEGSALSVTALVLRPDSSQLIVGLVEVAGLPSTTGRLFRADYVVLAAGWHVIAYNTTPDGGEGVVKFMAISTGGESRAYLSSERV